MPGGGLDCGIPHTLKHLPRACPLEPGGHSVGLTQGHSLAPRLPSPPQAQADGLARLPPLGEQRALVTAFRIASMGGASDGSLAVPGFVLAIRATTLANTERGETWRSRILPT